MEPFQHSVMARAVREAERSLAGAWEGSLVFRGGVRAVAALSRVASGSRILSLEAARGVPLAEATGSGFERAVAGPYRFLRPRLLAGPWGRAVRGGYVAAPRSALVAGGWLRPLGVLLVGLGLGSLLDVLSDAASAGRVAAWAAVALVGIVLVLLGPGLAAGSRASVAGRFLGRLGTRQQAGRSETVDRPRGAWYLMLALLFLLGAAAGALSGRAGLFTGGSLVLLAAFAAVLARPGLLLLVLAAFPWLNLGARAGLGSLGAQWDELLLIGSLALLLFVVFLAGRWQLRAVPITVPLLLAFAAAVGSITVNQVPQGVALFALRVTFQPLLFFYLGYLLPRSPRWIRATVVVFLLSSLALALHGLFQYVTGAPMPKSWVDARESGAIATRAYSIIENPNGLGSFLLLGAFLASALALSARRAGERVLLGAVALVLIAGIAVTFSRGAWIGLFAGFFGLALLAHRRLLAAMVAGLALGPLVVPAAFLDRLTFAFSSDYISKSLVAGRLYTWRLAVVHAAEHPLFGLGLGTFGGTSAVVWSYSRLWIDNYYLQLAAEGGLILLAAILWLLLRVGKGLVAAYLDAEDRFQRAFVAGAFGAFVAVVVANLTASVWETLVVGAGFWFLMGLAASPPGADRPKEA